MTVSEKEAERKLEGPGGWLPPTRAELWGLPGTSPVATRPQHRACGLEPSVSWAPHPPPPHHHILPPGGSYKQACPTQRESGAKVPLSESFPPLASLCRLLTAWVRNAQGPDWPFPSPAHRQEPCSTRRKVLFAREAVVPGHTLVPDPHQLPHRWDLGLALLCPSFPTSCGLAVTLSLWSGLSPVIGANA